MAFSFTNAGAGTAMGSPGVNLQIGPDLEDIQTEVYHSLRLWKKHC
jgi:hypothetical protein